ncbi:MAG: hypothetical protein LBB61_05660, partial [Treponema sp.]|nr:hypothetical protein [Treponema sp.]
MILMKTNNPNSAFCFRALLFAVAVLLAAPAAAQTQRQTPVLSGVLDTTVQSVIGKDSFAIQFEEYANLRLQTKIKEFAVFNAA